MAPQLLLTYDFPPIGGGIARWMAELAKRYPPGSLVVSTGQHPDAADVDATFPNRVDRLPLAARRLRTLQGLLLLVPPRRGAHPASAAWSSSGAAT